MCCHTQPPHSPKTGHGASTRDGPGSMTRISRATEKFFCFSMISIWARSPGAVPGTNITCPSRRPNPRPPLYDRVSMRSSKLFGIDELTFLKEQRKLTFSACGAVRTVHGIFAHIVAEQ